MHAHNAIHIGDPEIYITALLPIYRYNSNYGRWNDVVCRGTNQN